MVLRAKQYKDKEKLRITRNKQRKRYYNKYNFSKPKHEQKRYTSEDEIMIEEHSISDRELAKKLHRSVNAIQIKRVKLKGENL